MGLPTAEEMHDVFSVDADGTVTEGGRQSVPRPTGNIDPATGEVRSTELQPYTDDQFTKNLPSWRAAIEAGKATADAVIAKAGTKGTLTQEQMEAIRAPIEQPVTDVQPKDEAIAPLAKATSAITAQDLERRMREAQDMDSLYVAADLIGEVNDPQERADLTAFFEERKFVLEAE